jgi:hypothetical protein
MISHLCGLATGGADLKPPAGITAMNIGVGATALETAHYSKLMHVNILHIAGALLVFLHLTYNVGCGYTC